MNAASRMKGTIQPTGPGAQLFEIAWDTDGNQINYKLKVQWEPWVKSWLIKSIDPTQVWHRSRLLAIAGNELKINEINHRIDQVDSMLPQLLKSAVSDRESYELFDIMLTATKRYMKLDPEWIRVYIRDHMQSSLGTGYKWRQAVEVRREEWSEIKDVLIENLENMRSHLGYYSTIPWFSGIRARSDGLTEVKDEYSPEPMTRSRIILFHPSLSMYTAFIPQKAAWYTEVLSKTMDALGVAGKYDFPFILGGQVYTLASKLFSEGATFSANDGKAWDSSVGVLMGKYFHPFMAYFKNTPMLASGETFTSMLGTMASIVATRNNPGHKLILGDDMNIFNGPALHFPFTEIQPDDSRFKWILGVRFDIDPLQPRISGIKMSMDRAKSMLPIDLLPYIYHKRVVYRRRDPRTRAAWAGLFHGWFAGGTLIDALNKVKPGEFISPGEYIENIIEDQIGTIDPYAWAEREGIKELFTT